MLIFTAVTVLQAVIFYVAMSMTGVVNSINSNAENAGLQIDDEIISVNGINIQQIPFLQQDDFFKEIDKLSLVIIRKAVKMEINFNLEDQDKIWQKY